MSFNKTGETKVYKVKKGNKKVAKIEDERYLVSDLIQDSDKDEKDEKDVHN